jgi:hypothetical protein
MLLVLHCTFKMKPFIPRWSLLHTSEPSMFNLYLRKFPHLKSESFCRLDLNSFRPHDLLQLFSLKCPLLFFLLLRYNEFLLLQFFNLILYVFTKRLYSIPFRRFCCINIIFRRLFLLFICYFGIDL